MPCLVETVQPSTSGSRSRCTPSRETSGPLDSPRLQILSISSINTMPCCSTASMASCFSSSGFTSFAASSSISSFIASLIFSLRGFCFCPPRFWNMDCSWLVISSMPGGDMISTPIGAAARSISISLSSSWPSRSFLRNAWRAADGSAGCSAWPQLFFAGGIRTSSTRSSAISSAR